MKWSPFSELVQKEPALMKFDGLGFAAVQRRDKAAEAIMPATAEAELDALPTHQEPR